MYGFWKEAVEYVHQLKEPYFPTVIMMSLEDFAWKAVFTVKLVYKLPLPFYFIVVWYMNG